jgi:hypothetical protein
LVQHGLGEEVTHLSTPQIFRQNEILVMKQSKYLTPVVLLFIALIWAITITIEFLEYQFRKNGVEVIATFLPDEDDPDLVKEQESVRARPDYYIVSYTYEGEEYEETLRGVHEDNELTTSNGTKPVPGATIEAIVDPNDPDTIFSKESTPSWTGATVISLILLGILGLTKFFK